MGFIRRVRNNEGRYAVEWDKGEIVVKPKRLLNFKASSQEALSALQTTITKRFKRQVKSIP
jgi:hypothetical protein